MKTKIVYLGFVISSNELKMDPKNVRDIREWSSQRNVFELRSFHGLADFTESSLGIYTIFAHPY
jgi:hypothetical protein